MDPELLEREFGADTEPWISDLVAALFAAIGARYVAEIGTFRGHTTQYLLRIPTLERLWGFDLARHELVPDSPKLTMLVGDTADTFLMPFTMQHLDGVFVDGDHTLPGVAIDFQNAWKVLRSGGILCAHDPISWPAVKTAADEVCPHHIVIPTRSYVAVGQTGLLVAVKP